MSAFLLCFAAWTALALSMDRHHDNAFARTDTTPHPARAQPSWLDHPLHHRNYLRRTGWALLLLSLWLTAAPPVTAAALLLPVSLRVVAWVMALSMSALAVTALITWQPRHAPTVAVLAGVSGLCALVLGG